MNQLSLHRRAAEAGFTENDVVRDRRARVERSRFRPDRRRVSSRGQGPEAGRPDSEDALVRAILRKDPPHRSCRRNRWPKDRVVKGALRTVAEAARPRRGGARDARGVRGRGGSRRASARSQWRARTATARYASAAWLSSTTRRGPESRRLIDELRALGIRVEMLTGDALPVAREIARVLGLGEITRAPELRSRAAGHRARDGPRRRRLRRGVPRGQGSSSSSACRRPATSWA